PGLQPVWTAEGGCPYVGIAMGKGQINSTHLPTLAIVGRPNVGKSTLFNRLVGARRAIVGDEPGITRARLYGEGHWRGYDFRIVDTGGIIPEDKDFIPSEIFRQARVALDEAAAIVMVVDARTELAAPDLELARLLRKTGKPLFVAANKVDSDKQSSLADDLHRLGIREIVSFSADHGRGVDDLLDAVLAALPKKNPTTEDTESTEGKSTEGAPSFPRSVREGGDVDSQLPSTDNTEEYRKSKPQSQRSRRRQESTAPLSTDDRE